MAEGTDGALYLTTRCIGALTPLVRSISKTNKEKIEVSRSFQAKALLEDDPIYVGELKIDLLTHRDHSLPSSQNISTHLGFFWPINARYLDHVKGRPRYNLYVVGLKCGLGEKEREFVSKRLFS